MSDLILLAEAWFDLSVVHLVEISLFILLIWAVERRVHLSTNVRYALWALALLKVFVPPVVTLSGSTRELIFDQLYWLPWEMTINPTANGSLPLTISLILFLIWTTWIIALTSVMLRRTLKIRNSLGRAKRIEEVSSLRFVAHELVIYECPGIESPMVYGLWRHRLYLPIDWRIWAPEELESVLAHEAAHVGSRDVWVQFLQNLALLLFGLNPLVWLVNQRLNLLRELRCDEIAIAKTGISPVQYCRLIHRFLERQVRGLSRTALLGKSFAERKESSFARIEHLLSLKEATMKSRSIRGLAVLALFTGLILPFSWRCAEEVEQAPVSSVERGEIDNRAALVAYDEPPAPIGGFKAIQEKLHYPEIARLAGIEGRVIVQILITEEGKVGEIRVLESLGESGCDEAAEEAIRSVTWKPALRDGKPVKVWVAVPVIFSLG